MTAAIRNGIQKSFPGCQWSASPQAGAGTISIEVHRFASVHDGEVLGGRRRVVGPRHQRRGPHADRVRGQRGSVAPNYRGSDNEKESLTQAFQASLERTIKGLRALPSLSGSRALPAIDAFRPRQGTASSSEGPGRGGA